MFEKLFSIPVYWTVPYTCDSISREADFTLEAENSNRASEALAAGGFGDSVIVPRVVPEFVSRRVLVTEWFDGVKVTDKAGMQRHGIGDIEALQLMFRAFAHQLFCSGAVHCDPHPGNVLVRKGKEGELQVAILDHGLYCHLPRT